VGGIERKTSGEVESECIRVWEGERGRHKGGIESVCTIFKFIFKAPRLIPPS
jgi:hypothetical protein